MENQKETLVNHPFCQVSVGVNPPVAQERPVRARVVHLGEVNGRNQNLLLVLRGLGEDFAGGSGHETLAPELDAVTRRRSRLRFTSTRRVALARQADNFFMADAIGYRDVAAVGDGMAALDGLPGVVLAFAEFCPFAGMPADGGGVKKNFRALQRGQPRGFGIPLVPANQHADFAVARRPRLEAGVAGCEIKFLVIKRVVGNVHLAVAAEQRAVGVNHGGGVVIDTGGAFFKQ